MRWKNEPTSIFIDDVTLMFHLTKTAPKLKLMYEQYGILENSKRQAL